MRCWRYEQKEGTERSFHHPQAQRQGARKEVHWPLVASILGWQPGVSMHLGVIFIFPVMYLTKRELGELIPTKIKSGDSLFRRRQKEEESHSRGALVSS